MSGLWVNDWLGQERDWLHVIKYWQTEDPAWSRLTLGAYKGWLAKDLRRRLHDDIAEAHHLNYPVRAKALIELLHELNQLIPLKEENEDEC